MVGRCRAGDLVADPARGLGVLFVLRAEAAGAVEALADAPRRVCGG